MRDRSAYPPGPALRSQLSRPGSPPGRLCLCRMSVTPRNLGSAVGADCFEPLKVSEVGRLRVVAAAEGAVSDEPTIAPSLGRGDVPDVFMLALHAKRRLGAKLFCHEASLRAARLGARDGVTPQRTGRST